MTLNFHKRYKPVSAMGFTKNEVYTEIYPCLELSPYIRCFWGNSKPLDASNTTLYFQHLIIPDTCMDIIINIDKNKNIVFNKLTGLDNTPNYSSLYDGKNNVIFAVRFYFWAVPFFTNENLIYCKNSSCDSEMYFPDINKYLCEHNFTELDFKNKIKLFQCYLIKLLNSFSVSGDILNCIDQLVQKRGNIKISSISDNCVISPRKLQRLFKNHVGSTPKEMSELIRYQSLWKDVLTKENFNIQDEVFALGYYDQSHLLNEFNRYHGMSLKKALKRVANLQYIR